MLPGPLFRPIPRCRLRFDGWIGQYLHNITEHWLKVAPLANPGLLEIAESVAAHRAIHAIDQGGMPRADDPV